MWSVIKLSGLVIKAGLKDAVIHLVQLMSTNEGSVISVCEIN